MLFVCCLEFLIVFILCVGRAVVSSGEACPVFPESAAYTVNFGVGGFLYTIIIYIGIIKEITQKLTIFMRKSLRKICN